ncbi:MAG: hypothetical protein JXX28_12755, partial [Deltaproteobacteria bacterium]|nr:hypothetical protein [Deltaproteobacteria bacterium]
DEPARQVVAIPQDEPARQVVAIPQDEPARQVVSVPQEQAPREQAGPTLAPPAPEPGRGKGLMIGASLAVAFLAVVVCAGLSVGGLGVGLMGQGDRAATERLPIEPAVIAPAEPPPPAEVGSPPQGEVPAMRDPVGARTSQARPAQPDRPTARTAPPAQPAAPASRPAAQVTERVEPTRPAALPTPTRSVDPVEREEPDLSFLQEEREEALAELPPPPPPEELEVAIGFEDLRGELAGLSDKAYRGALTDADRQALAQVPAGDPARTQVLVLLYQDAKARGDQRARAAFIADALAMPENQYNPQLLVESAAVKMAAKDYAGALEQANIAERYWARLPSDSIFSRKAMIYEIQASAEQGIFYRSEGEDTEALHEAIRGWEKYLRHVNSKSRRDLAAKADEQLAKLYDMQRRLE